MENIKEAPKFSKRMRLNWAMASFGGALISGIYGAMLPIFYIDL